MGEVIQQQKKVPLGIKLISILYYLSGVLLILLGIFSFLMIFLISSLSDILIGTPLEGIIGRGVILFVAVGILFIALAIFLFFVARALWKLKRWAGIVTIIFSIISLIIWVTAIFLWKFSYTLLGYPVLPIIILLYLFLSKKVKEAFEL